MIAKSKLFIPRIFLAPTIGLMFLATGCGNTKAITADSSKTTADSSKTKTKMQLKANNIQDTSSKQIANPPQKP